MTYYFFVFSVNSKYPYNFDANVHEDLRQLSYGKVKIRSYGRYDVNGFQFCSTQFEAPHPLAATCNTRVVTRAIDAHGRETSYYGII